MAKKDELQTEGSEFRCVEEQRLGETKSDHDTISVLGKTATAGEAPHAGEITKPRLLIAENDHVVRQVLGTMFKMVNYEVAFAENGQKVVDMWDNGEYDLILMDVQMQNMDGLEATAVIREKERNRGIRIPIIAMTGYASKKDKERFLDAGIDDYISKPIDFMACLKLIGEAFKNTSMTQGVT